MNTTKLLRRQDLIEPELSYKIVGMLYQVSNELGPGLQEKYYQKALSESLKIHNLNFQEQVPIPLLFQGKVIGRYFADFVVDDKIVIEIKKGIRVNRKHVAQLLGYLKATNLSLGILAYFHTDGVSFKRILNTPAPIRTIRNNS